MPFLLDSNVLIDANRDYYPLERVPEFWAWLIYQAERGEIAMPSEMYGEVIAGRGDLVDWLKRHKDIMVLEEEADSAQVRTVLEQGYGDNLTEDDIQRIGNDPFIVAYALDFEPHATVVTTEVSRPSARKRNRRLPDVCAALGIACINTFKLVETLNFRTDWRAG